MGLLGRLKLQLRASQARRSRGFGVNAGHGAGSEMLEDRCLLAATLGTVIDSTDINDGPYLVHGMVVDASGVHWGGQTFTPGDQRGDPVTFGANIVDGVFQAENLQVLLQDIERSSGQDYPAGFGSACPFLDEQGLAWLVQSARREADFTNQSAGFEILRDHCCQRTFSLI